MPNRVLFFHSLLLAHTTFSCKNEELFFWRQQKYNRLFLSITKITLNGKVSLFKLGAEFIDWIMSINTTTFFFLFPIHIPIQPK